MPIDKTPAALKFFDAVIEGHGFDPDDVARALAVFGNSTSMEDVALRIKAKQKDGPYTALEIYVVDTDERCRPERMTNAIEETEQRNAAATDYMRSLSGRMGYKLTLPHGYVGDRQGYAHMGRDYFVAQGGLLLPRRGLIDLMVTMPFAETARSKKLPVAAGRI